MPTMAKLTNDGHTLTLSKRILSFLFADEPDTEQLRTSRLLQS